MRSISAAAAASEFHQQMFSRLIKTKIGHWMGEYSERGKTIQSVAGPRDFSGPNCKCSSESAVILCGGCSLGHGRCVIPEAHFSELEPFIFHLVH